MSALTQFASALEAIDSALDEVPPTLRHRLLELAGELAEGKAPPAFLPPQSKPTPPAAEVPKRSWDGASRNMHAGGKAVKHAIAWLEREGRSTPEHYAHKNGLKVPVARDRFECAAQAGLICRIVGPDQKVKEYCAQALYAELTKVVQ